MSACMQENTVAYRMLKTLCSIFVLSLRLAVRWNQTWNLTLLRVYMLSFRKIFCCLARRNARWMTLAALCFSSMF